MWNEEFTNTMVTLGFTQLKTDYCCFIQQENNSFTIIIVWVDNILAFSNSDIGNDEIKAELKSKFEVNLIGNPSMILGIKLSQEDHLISLSHGHFIDSLLNKFGLENVNPVTTPLDSNINLDDEDLSTEGKEDSQGNQSYATLIGSLMYLALGSHPDISHAVNQLAQFTQSPKLKHWTA